MPLEILRADITTLAVDAVVNSTNAYPAFGPGSDAGLYRKAGSELLRHRKRHGILRPAQAAVSPGCGLDAKFVIHTLCPPWRGGDKGERELLRRCYENALALAAESGCESVAFPLLGAGSRRFPRDIALQIAVSAISAFLLAHEMRVILAVFGREEFGLSERLYSSVKSYIDDNYVAEKRVEQSVFLPGMLPGDTGPASASEALNIPPCPRDPKFCCAPAPERGAASGPEERPGEAEESYEAREAEALCLSHEAAAPEPLSLEEMLRRADAGFSETLLRLIDLSGKKDSEIYKRANVDRKLFSKIRGNAAYKPSKTTALAFAVALELDIDSTRDLLARAGYALSPSSKQDIIVEYFIRRGIYDIHEINLSLFSFDQSLLGC